MIIDSFVAWIVSNPSEFVSDASGVAIVGTLILLYLQIRGEGKSRKFEGKSREFETYEKLMSDFSDVTLKLMDNPELSEQVYKDQNMPLKWQSYSSEQKRAYSYFDSLLGLFERVWIARKESNLGTTEVEAWKVWLRDLASIDIFIDVFRDNEGQFDSSLMREVKEFVDAAQKKKTDSSALAPPSSDLERTATQTSSKPKSDGNDAS